VIDLTTLNAEGWFPVLRRLGVKMTPAQTWAPVFADTFSKGLFSAGQEDILNFVPQIVHESQGLERMRENLNYSADRICVVWPSRFANVYEARLYEYNPEALANKVYGGRCGNKDPGDGWKYRGGGPLGVTFYDNYVLLRDLMGQDFDVMPELIEQPHYALEACIGWWESKIPDSMLGQQSIMRKKVNGTLLGYEQTLAMYKTLQAITA